MCSLSRARADDRCVLLELAENWAQSAKKLRGKATIMATANNGSTNRRGELASFDVVQIFISPFRRPLGQNLIHTRMCVCVRGLPFSSRVICVQTHTWMDIDWRQQRKLLRWRWRFTGEIRPVYAQLVSRVPLSLFFFWLYSLDTPTHTHVRST